MIIIGIIIIRIVILPQKGKLVLLIDMFPKNSLSLHPTPEYGHAFEHLVMQEIRWRACGSKAVGSPD